MTCKTFDFTAWYELQADSESDDDHGNGSENAMKDLSFGYRHSRSSGDHVSVQPEYVGSESKWYTLHTTSLSGSCKAGSSRDNLTTMQDSPREISDAAKKSTKYSVDKGPSGRQNGLPISGSDTSDGGMSLQEFSIEMSSKAGETVESGRDEAVFSVIAEISKDFTTGNLSTGPIASGESDESRISSDNEARHRLGAAYAQYPEAAGGFSDNDWNPYVTESDTNASPRGAPEVVPTVSVHGARDSRMSSFVSSFNPPFSSTKAGLSVNKTNGANLTYSRNSNANPLLLEDIREQNEGSFPMSKPHVTPGSQQLSGSKLSEYSISKQSLHQEELHSTNAVPEDYGCDFQRGLEKPSWPSTSGSSKKAVQASERQADKSIGKQGQEWIKAKLQNSHNGPVSGFLKERAEEKLKSLQEFEDLPHHSLNDFKSLPGKGYFSVEVQKALSDPQKSSQIKAFSELCFSIDRPRCASLQSGVLSIPSGGMSKTGQSEETVESQMASSRPGIVVTSSQPRESSSSSRSDDGRLSTSSTTSTVISSSAMIKITGPGRTPMQTELPTDRIKSDKLNQQVQKLLLETAYLTGSARTKTAASRQQTPNLDYQQLHLDLQEIQDNLKMTGQPSLNVHRAQSRATDSDNDSDIIPSTTTTPERGRQLMWDHAADLGYRQGEVVAMEGTISDITSACSPVDSRYSSGDRLQYTSDGEETRTSGSSLKEHAEDEEQAVGLAVPPQMRQTNEADSAVLDDLISGFRQENQVLQNRYQALCSQTVAGGLDLVRKRLDLSSLSDSLDAGDTQNSKFSCKPESETFAFMNAAEMLISNQMRKIADRTFNHSIEFRTPVRQVVECYPVYTSQRDQPQYQQLQQELQQHLQQQQLQPPVPLPPSLAPPLPPALAQQSAKSVVQIEGTESTEVVQTVNKAEGAKQKHQDDKLKAGDQQEDSTSGVSSPADSDRSSEIRRGKYRPYRPTGSQDIYYTESDTASVADSATTVESTHTGSDDAVAPYFPSSALGSRREITGTGTEGIYNKHGKVSIAMGSSVTEPSLPTIPETATPDRLGKEASEVAQSKLRNENYDSSAAHDNKANSAFQRNLVVTDVMAKRQARVEDILKERDAARCVPGQHSEHTGVSQDELAEHTNRKEAFTDSSIVNPSTVSRPGIVYSTERGPPVEILQKYNIVQSDRDYIAQQEPHRGTVDSSAVQHRSRIPVRGMGYGGRSDPSTAKENHGQDDLITSKQSNQTNSDVKNPCLQDNFRRFFNRELNQDPADRAEEQGKALFLKAFDAGGGMEVVYQRQHVSAPDNPTTLPRHLGDLMVQKQPDTTKAVPEGKLLDKVSGTFSSKGLLHPSDETSKARTASFEQHLNRDLSGQEAAADIVRESGHTKEEARSDASEQTRPNTYMLARLLGSHHYFHGPVAGDSEAENLTRRKVEDSQGSEVGPAVKERSEAAGGEYRNRDTQQKQHEQMVKRRQEEAVTGQEVETTDMGIQQAIRRREPELRKMYETETADKQTQDNKELLRREVEVTRKFHHSRGLEKETERQKEIEGSMEHGFRPCADAAVERELMWRGQVLLQRKETEEWIDKAPLSRRAQLLREALEEEETYRCHPDLQALWEHFLASSSADAEYEYSFDSVKLQALAELLNDPTQHLIHKFLQQRHNQREEDHKRAETQRQIARKELKKQESDGTRLDEELAMKRECLRQNGRRQQQGLSSEDESNGSYGEILQQREQERLKRREVRTQKKKQDSLSSPSPLQTVKKPGSSAGSSNNFHRETTETLYSIPEDQSLPRNRSPVRSRSKAGGCKEDVIDPNMKRLRDRILKQREKIEQEHRKEARRAQKLLKLKALLDAKCTGLMDDSTVSARLATISSTSASSSNDSVVLDSHGTVIASEESTTEKDSSTEMHQAKLACVNHDHLPFKHLLNTARSTHKKDLSMHVDESGLLWEHSSSQTDSEVSYPGEFLGVSDRENRQRPLTKYGAKHLKWHQLYSPYTRQTRPTASGHGTGGAVHWTVSPERRVHNTRDAGTMYPSPRSSAISYRIKHRGGRYVSQSAQTLPDHKTGDKKQHRSQSPFDPRDQQPVVPVSLMTKNKPVQSGARNPLSSPVNREQPASPEQTRPGKRPYSWQRRSVSPAFDSSAVAACLTSDDHNRSRSLSPQRDRNSYCRGHRSLSPSQLRHEAWIEQDHSLMCDHFTSRTKHQATSPDRGLGNRSLQRGRQLQKVSRSERIKSAGPESRLTDFKENRLPSKQQQKSSGSSAVPGGLSWFVPLTETRPWRQPLKEQQAYASNQEERWHQLLSQKNRFNLMNWGLQENKDVNYDSRNLARFYLDKASKQLEEELGQQFDSFDQKPLCRMSLQEALLSRKPEFVSAMRQRQKRLHLAAEHRRLQALVRAEQGMIFLNQRKIIPNPDAHPYSENLYQPKKRVFSKQEMKEMTEKKYQCLPEVRAQEIQRRQKNEYSLNRLRAKVFNKRVQRKVLDKMRVRSRF